MKQCGHEIPLAKGTCAIYLLSHTVWVPKFADGQQGNVDGMWLPVALDAIATVRFSGRYTLTGVDTLLAGIGRRPQSEPS